jgi:putative oxidoreductase
MIRLKLMQSDRKAQLLTALEWACRLYLAGVLFYAAWPKLMDPQGFAKAITNYRLVLPFIGQNYVYPMAMFIPALEAILGIGLLFARAKRASSFLTAGLLALFTVLILQAVLRGLNIDCGCFGSSDISQAEAAKVGWTRIAEDIAWFLMAMFVYKRSSPRKPRYRM